MTVRVAHLKVSSVPDSDGTDLVRPSDWNADHFIEGLGTAAESDTTDFATAAQGAKADTAVQPAAIVNMLETTDIGVLVQAYDSDLAAIAGLTPADSSFIVGNGTTWVAESGATVRTSIGLGTGNSPQFTSLNIGNSADTTVSRNAAGFIAVEGNSVPSPASQAAGDILYRGSSEWERLAKGTAGQVLTMNSGATAPEWMASREVLTANRTYYVRSDGSDSNTGLVDSSGGAFLTITKAISSALALDPSIYDVTIVLQNGTWGQVSMSTPMIGNKSITIQGSSSANVTLSSTNCATVSGTGASLTLTGLTLNGTTNCINVSNGGTVNIGSDIVFAGSSSGGHIRTNGPGSTVQVNANYSVTSGAARHLMASPNGFINAFARTITLSGTLNFSTAFADCDRGGLISTNGSTFTGGTITGKRYNVATNGVIFTGGAGASHFPGDVAGTTATGGQYA